jgi:hypothetical protein
VPGFNRFRPKGRGYSNEKGRSERGSSGQEWFVNFKLDSLCTVIYSTVMAGGERVRMDASVHEQEISDPERTSRLMGWIGHLPGLAVVLGAFSHSGGEVAPPKAARQSVPRSTPRQRPAHRGIKVPEQTMGSANALPPASLAWKSSSPSQAEIDDRRLVDEAWAQH